LTSAGEVFVAEARRLLNEARMAVDLVRKVSQESPGVLRVGYPSSINLAWLWWLISRVREDAGFATEIELISAQGDELRDQLIHGTLHAAFFTGQPGYPGLESCHLFSEPFTLACSTGHPLAVHACVKFEQLSGVPVVWLRRDLDPPLYESFVASCFLAGYRPRIVQEVRTFYECLQFAREGLGIAFLPCFMRSAGDRETVAYCNLPAGTLMLEHTLGYRRDCDTEQTRRFVRFVRSHLPTAYGAINTADHCHK
jgi:DNA-binding transcriptional LysR family regulator